MIDLANEAKTSWKEWTPEQQDEFRKAVENGGVPQFYSIPDEHWVDDTEFDDVEFRWVAYRIKPETIPAPNPQTPPTADLRDQFAMAALTGMITAPEWHSDIAGLAREAYLIADAMLKARGGDNG